MNSGRRPPRLPAMPVEPFSPVIAVPAAPPPPTFDGRAVDYETGQARIINWPLATETLVYTTRKRWRACDVYVSVVQLAPSALAPFIVSVFVYAIVVGQRTLVASGRLPFSNVGTALLPQNVWACAARAGAEKFEVTVRADGADMQGKMGIVATVIATDEAVAPLVRLGEITLTGNITFGTVSTTDAVQFATSSLTVKPPPRLEVVRVAGINSGSAARYLQLYEHGPGGAPTTVNMGDNFPVLEWPMGAAAGGGVVDEEVRFRTLFTDANMLLCVSTTAGVYTGPPADSFAYLTVR